MRRGSIDPAQATRKGWPYYTRAVRPIDGGGQGSYIVGPPLAGGLGLGPTGGLGPIGLGPGLTGGLGPIDRGPGLTGGLGPTGLAQATRKGWPYYTRAVRPIDGGGAGIVYSRATPCGWPGAGADRWPGAGADRWPGAGADRWPGAGADRWPGLTGGLGPIDLGWGRPVAWGRLTRPRPPARGGPCILSKEREAGYTLRREQPLREVNRF